MSGTNTGRAPRSDAEWARDTNRRLDALENPDTARVGEWVISSTGGQLIATKQGDQVIIGNSEVSATEFTDAIRGVHRDVEKVDEKATDAQETADAATPLDQFSKLLDAAKDAGAGVLTGGLSGDLLEAAQGFLNIFGKADGAQTTSTGTLLGFLSGWMGDPNPPEGDPDVYAVMTEVRANAAQRATPAYVGNETDMASFPRSMLFLPAHSHGYSDDDGTSTTNSTTSTEGGAGVLPSFTPNDGAIYYTPIWVDRKGTLDKFRVIAGGSGWFNLGLNSLYYGLYSFARSGQDGTLTKVWDSGNIQSSTNVSQRQEFSFQLPATAVEPGQLLFMATVQNRVFLGGGRPVAALPQGGVQRPADVLLRGSCYTSSGTTLPGSATLSGLSINTSWLPWFAASVNPPA